MTAPPNSQLDKSYRPTDNEPLMAKKWEDAKAFAADAKNTAGKPPYSIVIPPPNVTAALHMGHALNNTIQDILTRYHRMAGFNTLWMPGTDHAGIATQSVVDKRLQAEGKPALKEHKQMEATSGGGREQFIEKIQAWKDEYEAVITSQLQAMGCSCDWDRQRFTMDDTCAKAVREAFFQLFKDGLIYRGKRLVNWDPVSQTALSDDEVEMQDIDGNFYYMKYPVCDPSGSETGEFVTVATTRPETMLGDTAVAVNPEDGPRKKYIGQFVKLPIVNRVIPIIGDDYVVIPAPGSGDAKAEYASGFLKVTPAHDPNDYEIGQRHGLSVINVMAPDASISHQHGWPTQEAPEVNETLKPFIGLSREDARKAIVRWFKDQDLMQAVKPYRHAVGHSYRSHVPIEPYLSDQWYVKVTDEKLAGAALKAMSPEQRQESKGPTWREPATPSGAGFQPATGPKGQPIDRTLHRQSRRLPHWQKGGSTYFVTFRVKAGELSDAERDILLSAVKHWDGQRLYLHAAVVMPDHVHLLFTPLESSPGQWHNLSELMHSIKSFSANQINQARNAKGGLWQDESFDRIVRDEDEFLEKWNYLRNNAVKAALAERPEEYAWLWEETATGSAHGADDRLEACPTASEQPEPWEGGLKFVPERYAKTFQTWHENIRDWCISRQLWWGHRIPVWSRHGTLDLKGISPESPSEGFLSDSEWAKRGCAHKYEATQHFDDIGKRFITEYVCVPASDQECGLVHELEAAGFEQDPDVLDTWFSSGLWPLSTMGWPENTDLLDTFNPTSVLCTAREIITLWVSRMVMFNIYFRGQLPFKDVFIHAMIQDGHGQKMSKSLGNGVDPRDIIGAQGSDAMRFTLCQMTTHTQDVRMPVDMVDPFTGEGFVPEFITNKAGYKVAKPEQKRNGKTFCSSYGVATGEVQPTDEKPAAKNTSSKFDVGRNFATKLWNATRFTLDNLQEAEPDAVGVRSSLPDRWILSRTAHTIEDVNKYIAAYDFHNYANTIYHFVWNDLCDWYIESVKHVIKKPEGAYSRKTIATVLDVSLRLLHPVMPFITERLWEALNAVAPQRGVEGLDPIEHDLLATAAWPEVDRALVNKDAEQRFERWQHVVGMIREVRSKAKVSPRESVAFSLKVPAQVADELRPSLPLLQSLTNTLIEHMGPEIEKPAQCAVITAPLGEGYLHIEVDTGEEKERLNKRQGELQKSINALNGRLANKKYTEKAPSHLVQQTRDQLAEAEAELARVNEQIASL